MTATKLHKVPDSERAFIGSLFHLSCVTDEYDLARAAAHSIEPTDFHDPNYRELLKVFRCLLDRGEPFDGSIIVAECNGSVESPAYTLHEAAESVATSAHIGSHARLIRNAAEQRRAVCLVQDTLSELGRAADTSTAIAKLQTGIQELVQANTKAEPIAADTYNSFPVSTLPGAVAEYVDAAATAIGCDAAFIALPLLGCLARAIGNRRVIRLKRSWTEPAIVWAAIVGKSGTHKTPALKAATTFLNRKQFDAIAAYKEALLKFEQDQALYDRAYAAWKRSKSTEPPPWAPESPTCERFFTTDATIEALVQLLHSQFDGVLVPRDELSGWLNGIGEYKAGKGSDLGHWLAMWSAEPIVVDRKTGPVRQLNVPRAAVSIVGGIQPTVLRSAIGREHMADGLCARLLLAMPDPKPVRWTDATIDQATEAAMGDIFDRLIEMTPGADGDGEPEPFAMPLSPTAKSMWIEYYNRHRAESVGLEDDLAAAWSKLEAYAARFALIFQLCSWAVGAGQEYEVDEASVKAGIELADWFGGEARRVYGLFTESADDRANRELVELIRRRGGRIAARDLQMGVRQYRAAGAAESALTHLVRAGHGRWEVVPTGRRPRTDFVLFDSSTVSTSTLFNGAADSGHSVGVDNVDGTESLIEFESERASLAGEEDVPF